MDLLNRYRNLSVLLVAILAQLALLAYQVKSAQEVRLIRVWSVGAVTPLARVLEAGRSGVSHFFRDYFVLLGVRQDNQRLKAELDRAEMDNQYLRAQLSTADRAKALEIFQASSQSKTVAAHVVANTTDTGASAVVDRGSSDGVQKGYGGDHAGRNRGQGHRRFSQLFVCIVDHRPHLRRRRGLPETPRPRHAQGRTGQ